MISTTLGRDGVAASAAMSLWPRINPRTARTKMEIKRSFMQRSKAERITRPNPEAIEKGSSGLEELLDWARLAVTEFVQAGV